MLQFNRKFAAILFLVSWICSSCAIASTEEDAQRLFDQSVISANSHHLAIAQDDLKVNMQGLSLQTLYTAPSQLFDSNALLLQLHNMSTQTKFSAKQPNFNERILQIEISADDSKKLLTAQWNGNIVRAEKEKFDIIQNQSKNMTVIQVKRLDDQLTQMIILMKSKLAAIIQTLKVSSHYYLTIERKNNVPLRLVSYSTWSYSDKKGNHQETVTNKYTFRRLQ